MLLGFSTKNPMASFAFPSSPLPPKTPEERTAVLMEVKRLYLDRQYKQCAARAIDLLTATKETVASVSIQLFEHVTKVWNLTSLAQVHPMYRVYLAFYAGISYEFLGQSAHLYSSNRVTYLHDALDSFLECLSAIPESISLPKLPTIYPTPPPNPKSVSQPPLVPTTPQTCFEFSDDSQERSPPQPVPFETLTRMIDTSLRVQNLGSTFVPSSEGKEQTPFMQARLVAVAAPEGSLRNNGMFRVRLPPISDSDKGEEDIFESDSLVPSPLRVQKAPPRDLPQRDRGHHTLYDTPTKRKANFAPRSFGDTLSSVLNIDRNKSSARQTFSISDALSSPSHIPIPTKNVAHKSNDDTCEERKKDERKRDGQKRNDKIVKYEDITFGHIAQIVKFNRGVELLRSQVKANILDIKKHAEKVTEIQRARRARKIPRAVSLWSFSPFNPPEESEADPQPEPELTMDQFGNVSTKETKEQRIIRLRAEGWNTVGLRSSRSTWKGARYYKEFCSVVLNELSVDNEVV